jgi:hypothetical protein
MLNTHEQHFFRGYIHTPFPSMLSFLIPPPPTQQRQLTTLIQKQIMDVMSSSKFSSASAITQDVSVTAIGAGSKNTGIDIQQAASINTAAFLNDQTALELKSDLKEKLKNSIKNEASNMPFGQKQDVNTHIENVVDKSIETKFSRSSLVELNNSVKQLASITAIAGGINENIKSAQKADIVAKFASSVGTDIATKLVGSNETTNEQETKTTNFISDTIGSIGKVVNDVVDSALLGAYALPVMLFVLFICVIAAAAYVLRSNPQLATAAVGAVGKVASHTPAGIAMSMAMKPAASQPAMSPAAMSPVTMPPSIMPTAAPRVTVQPGQAPQPALSSGLPPEGA